MTPKDLPELPEPAGVIVVRCSALRAFIADQMHAYGRACYELGARSTARPSDDALWDQTLRERDRYHEWADKLAEAISRFIGLDIGEHSNVNNPWARAVDMVPAGTLIEALAQARSTAAQPVEPTDAALIEAATVALGWRREDDWLVLDIGDNDSPAIHVDDVVKLMRASPFAAPPAASGDSTPPSEPAVEVVTCLRCGHANLIQEGKAMAQVQGDPSGALRPEPEAAGQDLIDARRYRYLRDGNSDISGVFIEPGRFTELLAGQELDAVIDGKLPAPPQAASGERGD